MERGVILRAVGKHDRRNSGKTRRLKGQVKKKARLKRQAQERKAAAGLGAKKAATPKRPSKAAAASAIAEKLGP